MAWDFETDPVWQEHLDWAADFVKNEVEPIDLVYGSESCVYDKSHLVHSELLPQLQEKVKERGLWACHLGPDLGGLGYGQLKLGLLNEVLGRSIWAPMTFGCQAPDSGNAEILAHYGTEEQKQEYLQPLLDGKITSCFSMTEPQGGSDPGEFRCVARQDGNDWVIQGEKWFSSSLRYAKFAIVMCVTNPDVPIYQGASMLLVPMDTPGIKIIRHTGMQGEAEDEGNHAYVHYDDVRVPKEAVLGGAGKAFVIAQTRLGGGRIHHAMRAVSQAQYAFDMMCERVLSRVTKGEQLAKKQMVQEMIADSWIQLKQFRLQVLHAAWMLDKVGGHAARAEIAGVKVAMPKVLQEIVQRAMHLHGALGMSNEMPFGSLWNMGPVMGVADGPTEVHKVTIAREALKDYEPHAGHFPSQHLPTRRAAARAKLAHIIELEVGNL